MNLIEDELNVKIIEGILNSKTQDEIAYDLNVSTKTVYNRMKLLESHGYIKEVKKGVWKVDYAKIGMDYMGVVLLGIHNDREGMETLIEHLKKLDYVENVFEIIGSEYNLCIIVRFRGLEEAINETGKFQAWLNKKGIRIDRFNSFISGKTHKDHRRSRILGNYKG
ncbi:Transcriptional regulator [Archaeoglobus sulfaticallidus PM70-1]|uniref:Transcriptional regulator n=1 Tax=Archaeoglobus sulfaticallidus PM70-1 TaxID=387631 RepID=N0BHZ8_9EURY|nr:HTH domain-containing protein [Archaeoglobus sulfaticallidus]AGK60051.1 Transcriptional regulator [Archaeoglobus sulfaticallidus PM70-1]